MKARTFLLGLLVCGVVWGGHMPVSSHGSSPSAAWLFPGEYESHQAIWMSWPTYENKAGFPSTEPMRDMMRALHGHTHINLAVQDADDEAAARRLLSEHGVPLDHVHFFHIPHLDIWMRDMGPQFMRSRAGQLRITDWNFNYWGNEEPGSENSSFEEGFDRAVAPLIDVPVLAARAGQASGVRMVHEGGGVTHNGRGTMIAVESVVMQRNLGPGRFCAGHAPVTDYTQANTYASNPDWPACKRMVEREYRRMLGVTKVIWVPTGIVEDNGTFRGALAKHIQVPELDGIRIPHAGVYTLFPTNGHVDEFVRFVSPNKVVLAETTVSPEQPNTPIAELRRWIEQQNAERLAQVYDILSQATTEGGEPIEIERIPLPAPTFEVFQPGDGTYDYYAAYERWEDGSTLPPFMLAVWPASYVNYVPTNDVVLIAKFWKPGRPMELKLQDEAARAVIQQQFPGRKIVQIAAENLVRGGGGMNCITQQQPASARFASRCGWAKVRVDASNAVLYARQTGQPTLGTVPRLTSAGEDVYLRRLVAARDRVLIRVVGPTALNGVVGWINQDAIESAGERCSDTYSPN